MQSGNGVLWIAVRLVRFVDLLLRFPSHSTLMLSGQALFHSLLPFVPRLGEWAEWNVHARERSAAPPAGNVYSAFHSTDGRALERAKLKGFQFDKALSANFSSEQLTGINSRFFFHRSRVTIPPSFLSLSRERRRTRERISHRSAGATLCTTSYLI